MKPIHKLVTMLRIVMIRVKLTLIFLLYGLDGVAKTVGKDFRKNINDKNKIIGLIIGLGMLFIINGLKEGLNITYRDATILAHSIMTELPYPAHQQPEKNSLTGIM